MAATQAAARHTYLERAGFAEAERDRQARHSQRLSYARLITFLVALACLFWLGWPGLNGGATAMSGAIIFGLAFVALVAHHGRVEERVRWYEVLRAVSIDNLRRQERDWSGIEPPQAPAIDFGHPYAHDLGVVGYASLFHLLGGACTRHGQRTLLGWLLAPAQPEIIRARQLGVDELSALLDLRDELQARGRLLGGAPPDADTRFLAWAEEAPWFSKGRWRNWLAYLVPALTALLAGLHAASVIALPLWLAPLMVAYLLTWRWNTRVQATLERASPGSGLFRGYPALFRLLHDARFEAPALRQLQRALESDGSPAHMELERLRRYTDFGNVRYSTLGHFFAQILLLWDFHVLVWLESWQRACGKRVRSWLAALGEAEALAALAILRHDHADWAMPQMVESGAALVDAMGLAHPLLPPGAAVPNDVSVGPPGSFLLVTGSNMSGKSTLLRALGLNVVLAQAGGPVCAREMRLPPLAVHTSIRVQDSLDQGVSYFMAELLRLKQVVDAAEAVGSGVLYLLDEILQGTNAAERQVAARRVMGLLLDSGAIGVVTTHDLALAESPDLALAARTVHFRETVVDSPDGAAMSFDFILRPGIATSVNALRLMEMIGFPHRFRRSPAPSLPQPLPERGR